MRVSIPLASAAAPAAAVETELKLRVADGALEQVRCHPLLMEAVHQPVQALDAIYYDTPECELLRERIALRVRREGERWIQTVKWPSRTSQGAYRRNELEVELGGPAPDCARIVHPDLDPLFRSSAFAEALRPVFETLVTRHASIVRTAGGAVIEASLDEGEIRSGDRSEPVCELELELKEGRAVELFDAALAIAGEAPLHLDHRSKAARGYALFLARPSSPQKAAPLVLDPAMSVSAAFAAIAWSTLDHLQANEQGTLDGEDAEFLHQMRVALRRLRSALSVFSDALPAAAREPVVADLRWLGSTLGPARDWDVFAMETLPPLSHRFEGRAGIDAVAAEAKRKRSSAHRRMRSALRSRRYQRVLIGVARWLAIEAWREGAGGSAAALDAPVRAYARSELEARYERVRKRGRKAAHLNAEALHELRIAIKKLRYALDFFASLFEGEAVRRLRSRLSRLQDVLGTINDAATMQRLIGEGLAKGRGTANSEARGILLGWSEGRAVALRAEFGRAWKAFRRSETFW